MERSERGRLAAAAAPRRRRWRLGLRGLITLAIVGESLAGWQVRRAGVRRAALATIRAAGGGVSFRDERPEAADGRAWLYRWTGDEWFRTVGSLSLFLAPPDPPRARPAPPLAAICGAIARLGRVDRVNLIDAGALDAAALAGIRDLEQIRELTITGLEGAGPAAVIRAVADLTQVEDLYLQGLVGLQARDLAPLGRLGRLRGLGIEPAPADEACLDHLGPLGRLTQLDLGKTVVTDAGMRRLAARAPRLRSLAVDGSALTDRGVEAVAGLRDLGFLSLAGVPARPGQLTDASLVALGRLGGLRELLLTGGRFTDFGLDALGGLPLDRLTLDSIEASRAGIARLAAGRRFAYLGLHGPGVTDAVLPDLVGHLAPSATLDLSRSRVGDAGMGWLAPLKLRGLFLDATRLTDAGLATLTTGATLRLLMARDTPVTPEGAAAFRLARPGTRLRTGPTGAAD